MRSLAAARTIARDARAELGHDATGLLARLELHFWTTHSLDVTGVPSSAIDGSRAELCVAEGCVYYDERLDEDPTQKLIVLAHELGHVLLHPRVRHAVGSTDPILGSAYLLDGAGAIARYSRKMREEAEANAFALEFLCPAPEAFAEWRADAQQTASRMAAALKLPAEIVRAQLAEGLYGHVLGRDECPQPPHLERPLSERQRAAAGDTRGPVLVNAGPGTGKTATLVGRIAMLLEDRQERPEQVLILTFSNDAAEELRERLAGRFGEVVANALSIVTFHAFGVEFLRLHGKYVGLDAEPAILDEAAQQELVLELIGRTPCEAILDLREPENTAEQVVDTIGYCKDRGIGPAEVRASLDAWRDQTPDQAEVAQAEAFLALFDAYDRERDARGVVDFGDLILLPLRILQSHDGVRDAYRTKYRWIMVDEYQDVGRSVAELLKQLAGPSNPPWVVGDKRQAIYRFRGAYPENVDQFVQDFPGAVLYELEENHRSCAEIVEAANQLATLLENPDHPGGECRRRWTSTFRGESLGEFPIRIAEAQSDTAEHAGIVAQVETWHAGGVPLRDIAVLARRNIDVRNVVLALGHQGIAATTSGLVTAEGAAGDLAAVLTLPDAPATSLPRLALALERGGALQAGDEAARRDMVNATISALVARTLAAADARLPGASVEPASPDETAPMAGVAIDPEPFLADEARALVARTDAVCAHLAPERHRSDAFSVLLGFLFDGSDYLRRALAPGDGGERSMRLGEIVTTLAMAAGYRFTHSAAAPRQRRLGFADYLRRKLCSTVEALVPPRSNTDAVRVMTCHASKGLEFPCVVVAGQTLSQARGGHEWLPSELRPKPQDDIAQAESLLFVGVSRTKQALVVSYAPSKSGTGYRPRTVTPLLARWQRGYAVPSTSWSVEAAVTPGSRIGPVWGDRLEEVLPARELDEKGCSIRTYLEYGLGLEFPMATRPLYPLFVGRLRRMLQQVAQAACVCGGTADAALVSAIIEREWPADDAITRDHPHGALYRNAAARAAAAFAREFQAQPGWRHVDVEFSVAAMAQRTGDGAPASASGRPLPRIRMDLVAIIERADASRIAVSLHVGSLTRALDAKRTGVSWSKLQPAYRRLPFVLLRGQAPSVEPRVFSVQDGALYPLLWKARGGSTDDEAATAGARLTAIASGQFAKTASDFWCDQCRLRVICPHWMELATPEAIVRDDAHSVSPKD